MLVSANLRSTWDTTALKRNGHGDKEHTRN